MNRTNFSERGAALILALLIVSLVTGLATSMAGEHLLNIKYQRNYLDEEQAYFYLLSAEGLAQRMLFRDVEGDENYVIGRLHGSGYARPDNFCEEWVKPINFPIAGGNIRITIEDLNRRFNINLLAADQEKAHSQFPYNVHQERFVRLLQTFDLDIDQQQAIEITQSIYDWLDKDTISEGFGGMEDTEYSAENLPYRTSNNGIHSISELRLIPTISPALYRRLKDHVTVWPSLDRLHKRFSFYTLNVNTISPNLLRSLFEERGLQPIEQLEVLPLMAQQRSLIAYHSGISEKLPEGKFFPRRCGFLSPQKMKQHFKSGLKTEILGVESNQMIVNIEVRLGGITRRMETLMHRIKLQGLIQVWARAFGTLV